jgi:hypothetical protein
MGAGILPVAEYKGNIYYLFSQEVSDKKYSDFGGAPSPRNESRFDNAIREGYEETDGFFGTKSELKKKVNDNYIIRLDTRNGYHAYLFKIQYDSLLPNYFNNHHKFIQSNFPTKINKHGFFEKNNMKWFTVNELKDKYKFRSFYKEIIELIINNSNLIKSLVINKRIK